MPLGAAPRDSSVHPADSPQFSQGSFVLRADPAASLSSGTSGSILDAFILPLETPSDGTGPARHSNEPL